VDPLVASRRLVRFEAVAVAPFTTGLGNEHPLENGFAFLNPYGLPYLPGSGVKGVVRQAARELASGGWGDTGGWNCDTIFPVKSGKEVIKLSLPDVLFRRESAIGDTQHVRGALAFWDVIPEIEGDRLAVDVMTPHQTHYYQGGKTPHESGSPNPINFLTVPPKSRFTFYVLCNDARLRRLAPSLAEDESWKALIKAALTHAFQWLGFGAKTSVGYGAFEALDGANAPSSAGTQREQTQKSPSAASELVWADASLSWNAGGGGRLKIQHENKRAEASGRDAERLLQSLSPDLTQKLKRRGIRADVRVQLDGNYARPVEIMMPDAKE
jgi:CRISPR-associated protein Cmr6